MIPNRPRNEVTFAILAGVTGTAGSFAVTGYSRQFIVAPIDAMVVRLTPGAIIAWMIQYVGDSGHFVHIGLSFAIATGLLTAAAIVGMAAGRWRDWALLGVALAGVLAWGTATVVTGEPLLALAAAAPVVVFTGVGMLPHVPGYVPSRRRVLVSGAGALAFVGISAALGRRLSASPSPTGTDPQYEDVSDAVAHRLQQAEDRSLEMAGDRLPGLVSSIGEFYTVDIAEFDPVVPAEDWSLSITGAVAEGVSITFDELTAMPVEHRYVTLRCVGESLNGRKMDNAVWTGTPIKPLLEAADPGGACGCAMLRAADGYFVQFPVSALDDGFLAWEMNGQPLPQSHGHPVRVLVPGHWGETNVKWLEEIELLEEELDGFWEQRGWHGTGPVTTVAKLWDDTRLPDGRIEVAGHAYAGTRGIDRVEVSTDGGATWVDAELSEPLPAADVWRQWRHVYTPDGTHEVVVRATDGEGNLQPKERSRPFPRGATGWVSKTIRA